MSIHHILESLLLRLLLVSATPQKTREKAVGGKSAGRCRAKLWKRVTDAKRRLAQEVAHPATFLKLSRVQISTAIGARQCSNGSSATTVGPFAIQFSEQLAMILVIAEVNLRLWWINERVC